MYYERLMSVAGLTKSAKTPIAPNWANKVVDFFNNGVNTVQGWARKGVQSVENFSNRVGRKFGGADLEAAENSLVPRLQKKYDALQTENYKHHYVHEVDRARQAEEEILSRLDDLREANKGLSDAEVQSLFNKKYGKPLKKAQKARAKADGALADWRGRNDQTLTELNASKELVKDLNNRATNRGMLILGGSGLGLGGAGAYAVFGGDGKEKQASAHTSLLGGRLLGGSGLGLRGF